MLHPTRFPVGSGHSQRMRSLRQAATLVDPLSEPGFASPLRYTRTAKLDGRDFYIVQFGQGEYALEGRQVEVWLAGFAAGLLAGEAAVSRAQVLQLLGSVSVELPEGQVPEVPKAWTQ